MPNTTDGPSTDLVVTEENKALRIQLPNRDLGKLRHLGWFCFIPATMLLVFLANWLDPLVQIVESILKNQQKNGQFDFFLLIFMVPFFAVAMGLSWQIVRLACAGIGLIRNRTYTLLVIKGDKLRAYEVFYMLKWKRATESLANVQFFEVDSLWISDNFPGRTKQRTMPDWLTNLIPSQNSYKLQAGFPEGRTCTVLMGYSESILKQVPEAIQRYLIEANPISGKQVPLGGSSSFNSNDEAAGDRQPPDPRMAWNEKPNESELGSRFFVRNQAPGTSQGLNRVLSQPSNSKMKMERRDDGITLGSRARGLFGPAAPLAFFATFWMGIVGFITVAMVRTALAGGNQGGAQPGFMGFLILVPFQAIGIFLIGLVLYHMTVRLTIATSFEELFISKRSLFGTRTHQFEAHEIESIVVEPNDVEINGRPLLRIGVYPKEGKKVGVCDGYSIEELEWIVDELHRSLGLDAGIDPEGEDAEDDDIVIEMKNGKPIQPSESSLLVEELADGVRITSKPIRTSTQRTGIIAGCLFVTVGLSVPIIVFLTGNGNLNALFFFLIWSSMFCGFGFAIASFAILDWFTIYQIDRPGDAIVLICKRPWQRQATETSTDQLRSVEIEVPWYPQAGTPRFQLSLDIGAAKPHKLMSGMTKSDLCFVRAWLTN